MTTTSMMNRASWAAFSLAVALALPASACARRTVPRWSRRHERDWRQLNTASAIRGFERATADPRWPPMRSSGSAGSGRSAAGRPRARFPAGMKRSIERPLALAAYRRAAELRPTWAEPHVAVGEALLLDGRPAEARTAFERALALASGHPAATRGLARANGATPADPDAEALARMDAALKAGQPAEVVSQARAFVAASPESPLRVRRLRPVVRGAPGLEGLAGRRAGPGHRRAAGAAARPAGLRRRGQPAADARGPARSCPDHRHRRPGGGGALHHRERAVLQARRQGAGVARSQPRAVHRPGRLGGVPPGRRGHRRAEARRGGPVLERQRLPEPVPPRPGGQGPRRRRDGRASATTTRCRSRARRRCSRCATPLRPAWRRSTPPKASRPPTRQANIARELERRRDERRRALLSTAVGKALPRAADHRSWPGRRPVCGRPGQVTLLNFFAAWCGACRQEMPLIQQVYERYKDDPAVRFVLVSLDDDPKRLERYVAERKFQMPVLRMTREQAAGAARRAGHAVDVLRGRRRHHPLRGARPRAARRRGGADQLVHRPAQGRQGLGTVASARLPLERQPRPGGVDAADLEVHEAAGQPGSRARRCRRGRSSRPTPSSARSARPRCGRGVAARRADAPAAARTACAGTTAPGRPWRRCRRSASPWRAARPAWPRTRAARRRTATRSPAAMPSFCDQRASGVERVGRHERRRRRLADRRRDRRPHPSPGGVGGIGQQRPDRGDLLGLAVDEEQRHVARRLAAAQRHGDLARVRRPPRRSSTISVDAAGAQRAQPAAVPVTRRGRPPRGRGLRARAGGGGLRTDPSAPGAGGPSAAAPGGLRRGASPSA